MAFIHSVWSQHTFKWENEFSPPEASSSIYTITSLSTFVSLVDWNAIQTSRAEKFDPHKPNTSSTTVTESVQSYPLSRMTTCSSLAVPKLSVQRSSFGWKAMDTCANHALPLSCMDSNIEAVLMMMDSECFASWQGRRRRLHRCWNPSSITRGFWARRNLAPGELYGRKMKVPMGQGRVSICRVMAEKVLHKRTLPLKQPRKRPEFGHRRILFGAMHVSIWRWRWQWRWWASSCG